MSPNFIQLNLRILGFSTFYVFLIKIKLLIRFIPEDKAFPDEIEAIKRVNESIEKFGTISHDEINWDC